MEKDPMTRSSRRQIPAAEAATRLHEPDQCAHNGDMATDKAQRRVSGLFIRFAMTQLLGCKTDRAPTDMQAGQSHCGNCECAHWATTSAPRDDKMPRVLSDITNGNELTPNRQNYLKCRMGLSEQENEKFQALQTDVKVKFVHSRITAPDMRNSLYGTAYAKQLSSTLEGPIAANDLDQALEKKFRPTEDRLSDGVTDGKMNYSEATSSAYQTLVGLLEEAVPNLEKRVAQLERYHALECQLDLIESTYFTTKSLTPAEVDDYARSVEELLNLRTQLLSKLTFTVNLKTGTFNQISSRSDFFWLKSFNGTMGQLADPSTRFKAFELHMQSIKKMPLHNEPPALTKARIRLLEARAQLEGMNELGACHVANLDKWLFGVVVDRKRRAPTEQELRTQLIEMTKKEEAATKTNGQANLPE
ncbi:hypothetical protein ACFLR2_02535 [Chlamydiota bacterium]